MFYGVRMVQADSSPLLQITEKNLNEIDKAGRGEKHAVCF